MLIAKPTKRYLRDLRRLRENGYDTTELKRLVEMLLREQPLPSRYKDHELTGDLHKWRDAHVEDDWVLVYRVIGQRLLLARTGEHEHVFRGSKRQRT